MNDSDVQKTVEFFQKAYPDPKEKNFQTQLGVHFEEISEMLEVVKGTDRLTQSMLTQAFVANHALALHLKNTKNYVIGITDRVEFLDGLCDQIVTATGVGHMAAMDIAGGFAEVNLSNNSKFDGNGKPILDNNLKMVKGPHYFKPNLEPFV